MRKLLSEVANLKPGAVPMTKERQEMVVTMHMKAPTTQASLVDVRDGEVEETGRGLCEE